MKQLKHITVKAFLIVFAILLSFNTKSQTDPLRLKLDSIFEHVDKSQIPSGFLEEYGAEFANLKTYNGVLTDSNISHCIRNTIFTITTLPPEKIPFLSNHIFSFYKTFNYEL